MTAYSDFTAAEHLQFYTKDKQAMAKKLRNYRSLFVGKLASVSIRKNVAAPTTRCRLWVGSATSAGYGSAPISKFSGINGPTRVASLRSHHLLPGKARARPWKAIVARRAATSLCCKFQPDFPLLQLGP